MISLFIDFTANSFGRKFTIRMLTHLSSHFGGSSLMLRFNCTSVSVGKFVSPAPITPVDGAFSMLFEFHHGP